VSDTLVLLVLPAAALLVSAGLLVHALRGRRVDDHPVCRKCGFDLFGKPTGSSICSECGADLTRPRATRVGRRERRRRVIAVALPVLLLCTAWLGLLGWGAARGTDWNRHKPAWWLVSQARGLDVAARDAALAEMTARLKAGKLSQLQIDALADLALDLQADASRPWSDVIGDAVGAARQAGQLSPARWQRYARQATVLRFETRTTLRRGERLVGAITWALPRMSSRHLLYLETRTYDLFVGPVHVGTAENSFRSAIERRRPYSIAVRLDPGPALAALPDGAHTVRCVVRVRIDEPKPPPATVVDEPVELTAPITVLPANAETVRVTTDPALRAAVEKSLRINNLFIDRRNLPGSPPSLSGTVYTDDCPIGLAFRVSLRRGEREWDLGAIRLSAGRRATDSFVRQLADLPGFPAAAEAADVILRPSPKDAVDTVDITEVWGEEVVRKDVPVVLVEPGHIGPAAAASTRPAGRRGALQRRD
jgi:hypothetical protein